MKKFIINSKKASQLWGGLHIGYVVSQEEIAEVTDKVYGDTIINILHNTIEDITHIDMCVCGKMNCRDTAHCIGESCDFCGKFTTLYE